MVKLKKKKKSIPVTMIKEDDAFSMEKMLAKTKQQEHFEKILQVGDRVLVRWTNTETYKGIIKAELRKNWRVEIQDKNWKETYNTMICPIHVLKQRSH